MIDKKKHTLHIFLEHDQYDKLLNKAKDRGLRPTSLARSIVVSYINKVEKIEVKNELI